MTLTDLQVLTSTWLDDLANGYFTLPQINVWLNNAQREVQKLLLNEGQAWYMKCATTTLVAQQGCYFTPADFFILHKFDVILSGTNPSNEARRTLVHLTPQEISGIDRGFSSPTGYFLKKNAFEIRPVPDIAYNVELLYSPIVADMVLPTDSPDIPQQYHELLAIMATIDGHLRDRRDPSAFMAKKDAYIMLLKQSAQDRLQDQPRSVVVVDSYDSYLAW